MQGFSAMNKLKQQALFILAKNMAPAEVAGLRAIFQVRCRLRMRIIPVGTGTEAVGASWAWLHVDSSLVAASSWLRRPPHSTASPRTKVK